MNETDEGTFEKAMNELKVLEGLSLGGKASVIISRFGTFFFVNYFGALSS